MALHGDASVGDDTQDLLKSLQKHEGQTHFGGLDGRARVVQHTIFTSCPAAWRDVNLIGDATAFKPGRGN